MALASPTLGQTPPDDPPPCTITASVAGVAPNAVVTSKLVLDSAWSFDSPPSAILYTVKADGTADSPVSPAVTGIQKDITKPKEFTVEIKDQINGLPLPTGKFVVRWYASATNRATHTQKKGNKNSPAITIN